MSEKVFLRRENARLKSEIERLSRALDGPNVYCVIAEGKQEEPLIMEVSGQGTGLASAVQRSRLLADSRQWTRVAVARLVYETGNALLLHDMERMQRCEETEIPF